LGEGPTNDSWGETVDEVSNLSSHGAKTDGEASKKKAMGWCCGIPGGGLGKATPASVGREEKIGEISHQNRVGSKRQPEERLRTESEERILKTLG